MRYYADARESWNIISNLLHTELSRNVRMKMEWDGMGWDVCVRTYTSVRIDKYLSIVKDALIGCMYICVCREGRPITKGIEDDIGGGKWEGNAFKEAFDVSQGTCCFCCNRSRSPGDIDLPLANNRLKRP
uniref:Uncharacterized protein n=1 Tax=Vespula pensylvanica TaxID=30213 RepID=A0A834JVH9_VESPE|nr:hypothetical protein H0235_017310 [Vespula pensylvanica]